MGSRPLLGFDGLVDLLSDHFAVVRRRPHAVVFEVDGEKLEAFRITIAGRVEWAALTTIGGPGAPPRNPGMAAAIPCREGWALRLVFPVTEVSPETFRDAMWRMALETQSLRRANAGPAECATVFEMWVGRG